MNVAYSSRFQIWKACSDSSSGPLLTGVFVDPAGWLVASNTAILAAVPCKITAAPEDFPGCLVPGEFLKKLYPGAVTAPPTLTPHVAEFSVCFQEPAAPEEQLAVGKDATIRFGGVVGANRKGGSHHDRLLPLRFPDWRRILKPCVFSDFPEVAEQRPQHPWYNLNTYQLVHLAAALGGVPDSGDTLLMAANESEVLMYCAHGGIGVLALCNNYGYKGAREAGVAFRDRIIHSSMFDVKSKP